MNQAVAQVAPDGSSLRLGPDSLGKSAGIDVKAQDHVNELRVKPELTEPEPVNGRPADQVTDACPVHTRSLVGNDDRSAGTRDPAHLAQGRGMVSIVSEAADRVAGVKRRIREGKVFGLRPRQPPSGSWEAITASGQLCSRDVHSIDSPGWR